jgi:hypothetical protein
MRRVPIAKVRVSGLCIGGNPFSGFSHQSDERSREMTGYYTPQRIKETWAAAEKAGINTFFGRTDRHIIDLVKEYWDEGGTIQWFAQVCTEDGKPDVWRDWLKAAVALGASGTYLHGGVVDLWYANQLWDNFREALGMMRDAGVAAGFAGHNADAHAWIRDNLQPDFQMCSYYNPTDRSQHAGHISAGEKWDDADRARMLEVIASIKTPVVHYKVFAGGNRPIVPSFQIMGEHMRPSDVACIGLFLKDDPQMITKDIALFEKYVDGVRVAAAR